VGLFGKMKAVHFFTIPSSSFTTFIPPTLFVGVIISINIKSIKFSLMSTSSMNVNAQQQQLVGFGCPIIAQMIDKPSGGKKPQKL
jgi:hypothetical protein